VGRGRAMHPQSRALPGGVGGGAPHDGVVALRSMVYAAPPALSSLAAGKLWVKGAQLGCRVAGQNRGPGEGLEFEERGRGTYSCAKSPRPGWFFLVTFFVHTKKVTHRR